MANRDIIRRFQTIDLHGANDLQSLENFKQRKMYAALFPTQTEGGYKLPGTIDFWNNPLDTYYGRIDRIGDVIVPNVLRMKPITALTNKQNNKLVRTAPMYVFNFVADAFKQFQKYMNFGAPAQKIRKSPWEGIKPKRAWFNINEKYETHLRTNLMDIFSDEHLHKFKNSFNILNARDYVDEFFNNFIYSAVTNIPVTQTAYVLSGFVGPLDTALCIDLSKLDESEDFVKFNAWVKDPSFDYVRFEAARHGFMIDKNAPWRLVANVASHQMRMLMKSHNVLDEVYFLAYYDKSLYKDIPLLKKALHEAYNKYAKKHPIETKPKDLSCKAEVISTKGSRRVKVDFIQRSRLSFEEFDNLFDAMYWYEKYFHLRLRETGIYTQGQNFNNQLFERHMKKISLINNYVDSKKALEYINNYIKKRWQPVSATHLAATNVKTVVKKPSTTNDGGGGMSGY